MEQSSTPRVNSRSDNPVFILPRYFFMPHRDTVLPSRQICKWSDHNYQIRPYINVSIMMYSAFTDKVERNYHFPAGTEWLTAKRYKVFPGRVNCRFIRTINSTSFSIAVSAGNREVTVALNFISERTEFVPYVFTACMTIRPRITIIIIKKLMCVTTRDEMSQLH
jgi:hypothetical protein